jgi:hypothetical protein
MGADLGRMAVDQQARQAAANEKLEVIRRQALVVQQQRQEALRREQERMRKESEMLQARSAEQQRAASSLLSSARLVRDAEARRSLEIAAGEEVKAVHQPQSEQTESPKQEGTATTTQPAVAPAAVVVAPAVVAPQEEIQHQHQQQQQQLPKFEVVVAAYDFKGEKPTDLPFNKGDVISVSDKKKSGWWSGRIVSGSAVGATGLFPGNYVKPHAPPPEAPSPSQQLDVAAAAATATTAAAAAQPGSDKSETKKGEVRRQSLFGLRQAENGAKNDAHTIGTPFNFQHAEGSSTQFSDPQKLKEMGADMSRIAQVTHPFLFFLLSTFLCLPSVVFFFFVLAHRAVDRPRSRATSVRYFDVVLPFCSFLRFFLFLASSSLFFLFFPSSLSHFLPFASLLPVFPFFRLPFFPFLFSSSAPSFPSPLSWGSPIRTPQHPRRKRLIAMCRAPHRSLSSRRQPSSNAGNVCGLYRSCSRCGKRSSRFVRGLTDVAPRRRASRR